MSAQTAPHPDAISELRTQFGSASWEVRHALWRERNECRECERIERGLDSASAASGARSMGVLTRARSWARVQQTLLPGRARGEERGHRSWSVSPDPDPEPRDPRSLAELLRAAELLTLKIAGNNVRGPAQNRVQWQSMQNSLQLKADTAWRDYYKKLEEQDF